MNQPDLTAQSVVKRFGDHVAVDSISFEVARGSFFSILGPSGCGKTTLLRMIAGFLEPDGGDIAIGGKSMSGVAPNRRPVNMVFQQLALFPMMSVGENVEFGLARRGIARAERRRKAEAMLERVGLAGSGAKRVDELSGGQRQRVAIARSLVLEPTLLLLDEPLGALDKKLREHTQFELIGLQDKLGVTFLVVTHDQEEAMTLASRIAVMDRGSIVQAGTPAEIYEFPNSKFVADFIGSVNLFEGRLVEDEPEHVRIASAEIGGTILVGHGISSAPDATLWAAVRPEKITMSREAPSQADNVARGIVQDVAYLGDLSIYVVRLPTGKLVRVTRPNASRHAEPVDRDSEVYLSWDAASPVVVTH